MQSDDGKMMKFIISFEALWTLVFEEVVMHECLRALDAPTTISVMSVSAGAQHCLNARELLALNILYLSDEMPQGVYMSN